jgi:predicted esterase
MDTFEGMSKYVVQAVTAPDPDERLLNDFADELAERKEYRAIPLLIGVINATNSNETTRYVGQSGLGKLTDVQSSRFHDGAWWRRWWEENKSNFPEEVRAIPIPDFPKTAQARNYVPFPENLDTFEGVVGYITRMFEKGNPDIDLLGSFAQELANREDPRAIPLLIGVIDADNSSTGGGGTIYGVGYFGLCYLTDVEFSRRKDGAWWRRWWEENKSTYPEETRAVPIPEFPKTAHGRTYVPFPEALDTAEGKSAAIRRMVEEVNPDMKLLRTLSEELVAQTEERAIPLLIGIIALDNSYDTVYGIGYFALRHPTGVSYDETHDGDWWLDWWQQNKSSYSAEVQALEVPDFSPYAAEWKEKKEKGKTTAALADVADASNEDRLAAEDEDKRYFLIGANEGSEPSEGGYRLLVVMPGGDGGANFNPFVRRIFKNALPGKYLVAQVVSKQWDEGQFDRLVWPTKTNPWPDMKFSTEEFVESIIREVTSAHTVNPNHIYTLSWSSGGPAAYAISLQENTAVKGSFVAMSVFKPDELPPLEIAKNHAYYLLHSPQDFIPMAMAEKARDRLGAMGASVFLQTYEGGHGWHGDVYGMIRSGIKWLEEQAPSAAN